MMKHSNSFWTYYCVIHPIFRFWFLVTMNLRKYKKYYVIFVYNLQGQDGKKRKENHTTKVTKIPNTAKNRKTKIWDKRNIRKVTSIKLYRHLKRLKFDENYGFLSWRLLLMQVFYLMFWFLCNFCNCCISKRNRIKGQWNSAQVLQE